MYCAKCGIKLNEDVKFCAKCGASVTSALSTQETEATAENVQSATHEGNPKGKSFLWMLVGMGIMLVFVLAAAGVACLFRRTDKSISNPPDKNIYAENIAPADDNAGNADKMARVNNMTLMVGSADQMTKDAAILSIPAVLSIQGLPEGAAQSMASYAAIAQEGSTPIRAYYCNDMMQLLQSFAENAGYENADETIHEMVENGMINRILERLPNIFAGYASSDFAAAMSVSSYSRILHVENRLDGVESVILQYPGENGSNSYKDGIYTWTFYSSAGEDKIRATVYYVTPIFNMEQGQELIKNWIVLEQAEIGSMIAKVADFDFNAPTSEKSMEIADYLEIAKKIAGQLTDTDFMKIADLYTQEEAVRDEIENIQSAIRSREPQYDFYAAGDVAEYVNEALKVMQDTMSADDYQNYFPFIKETMCIKAVPAMISSLIAKHYDMRQLVADNIMSNAASLAAYPQMECFPKPSNWNGPKIVMMNFENTAVIVSFYEIGNNYIGICLNFLSDNTAFKRELECGTFGFLKNGGR